MLLLIVENRGTKNMKDKKFIFVSILALVFLLTVGLTYAYFSLTVSGNDVAETINVSTTKIGLIYTDGKEVKSNNIEPNWTTTKTITVENTGNEEAYYALGWQKLYNEIQKDELVIRSTCTSSGVTGGTCSSTDNVVIPQTSEVTAETNKVLYPYKENVLILPGETHTYTVTIEFINYDDKAQNYNQGKRFYGVLGAAESSKKVILANYLIDNYSILGLTKIDQAATGNQNYATTEYRYQGATPNNYITFNGEENVWRIIGVFEVETPNADGTYTKEYRIKIIRDSIGENIYDASSKNNWVLSSIKPLLEEYYNRTGAYENNGLTDQSREQIDDTKWYLGNVVWTDSHYYGNTKEIYTQERSTSVHSGNKQTWDGKVALIYPSDYMYASSACYNDDTKRAKDVNIGSPYNTDYRNTKCKSTDWLNISEPFWNISPASYDTTGAMMVATYEGDSVNGISVTSAYDIRPTIYLVSSIGYESGSGTTSDPFIIK